MFSLQWPAQFPRFGDDGCPRTLQAFLDSIGPNLYFRYRWEREREAVSSGTLSEYLNIPTSLPNTRHKSLINYVLCRSSNNPHHTAIAIEKMIFIVLPLSEFYLIFSVKAAKFPINHWRMTATEGWWAMLQRWRTFSFPEKAFFPHKSHNTAAPAESGLSVHCFDIYAILSLRWWAANSSCQMRPRATNWSRENTASPPSIKWVLSVPMACHAQSLWTASHLQNKI